MWANTSLLWFYLRWAGWLMLLTACLLTIWRSVCYGIRRRNLTTAGTNTPWPVPDRMFIPWKYLTTLGRMLYRSRFVQRHSVELAVFFGFLAGNPVGYMVRDIQTTHRLHHEAIHVLQDLGNRQYTVECGDPQGCRFEVGLRDPGFDAGDWMDVTYEEMQKPGGGIYNSFDDEERTGWRAIPGHAKNREVTWTTPQQSPQ